MTARSGRFTFVVFSLLATLSVGFPARTNPICLALEGARSYVRMPIRLLSSGEIIGPKRLGLIRSLGQVGLEIFFAPDFKSIESASPWKKFFDFPLSKETVRIVFYNPYGDPVVEKTLRIRDADDRPLRLDLPESKSPIAYKVFSKDEVVLQGQVETIWEPEKKTIDKTSTQLAHPRNALSWSDPFSVGNIQFVTDAFEGLNEKVFALTGSKFTPEFVAKKDPFLPLDFSKAPVLNEIVVSYLVFRADYSGNVLRQALEHHAKKGAKIYIIASEVISLDRDKAMLDRFVAQHPNVHYVSYRWEKGQGTGAWIHRLHRTMHTKILLGVGPEQAFFIHGGRNIHDGFHFSEPMAQVLIEKHETENFLPFVMYGDQGGAQESFASWVDFDAIIRDKNAVIEVLNATKRLFYRDHKTGEGAFTSSDITDLKQMRTNGNSDIPKNWARYFISIPQLDGRALERHYVESFLGAKKSITITSPYFRPPKAILMALVKAARRGVKVKIITRVDLTGDTADAYLREVNVATINKYFNLFDIYEYVVPGQILHDKLVVIDEETALISSVNLNHRSFIHDGENGLEILSPKVAQDLTQLIDGFIRPGVAEKITTKKHSVRWRRWVVDLFKGVF